jgi:serine/threonine-protein kinase RsbW
VSEMVRTSSWSSVDIGAVLLVESVDVGSLEAVRERVREVGQGHGLDGLRLAKFVLVVHELVVNAVRHGGGWADVVVWSDALGLRCSVTDRGCDIAKRCLDPPGGGPDAQLLRHGLRLVRQICHTIRIGTGRHGTHIEIGYSGRESWPGLYPGTDATAGWPMATVVVNYRARTPTETFRGSGRSKPGRWRRPATR